MRRKRRPLKSILMIQLGKWEIVRYGPPRFYNWKPKTQVHYLLKRWPKATGCCDGVSWEQGGRSVFVNRSAF